MRILVVMLIAMVFGVAMSVLKGNDTGIRDDIGNLSAPWLLVAFFAGAAVRARGIGGAAAGLLATMTALAGFYAANAFVLDLGHHSLAADLRLTFAPYWFVRGVVSGLVFGFLGAWWRRGGYASVGVAAILLLDAEPLFWAVADRAGGAASFAFHPAVAVSIGEAVVGLSGCAVALAFTSRTRGGALAE